MAALIALLISLLGYGTPSDYDGYTEEQLNAEIAEAEAANAQDGGGWDEWNTPGYTTEP